ncbi:MAG: single-stranded DNA-binding protein [Deltaproteobacteria bacterium]|nr:MAG: single-stranded DNA-binding protein [Deltaproteobacteria bacterium]
MLNKATLIGRLGADPEIRYTQNETPVAVFSLATSEQWKNDKGETQERTEWHRVIAWDNLAKICEDYLKKGKLVFIEGPLRTRTWEDKEGNTRRVTEVVARTIKMLDRVGDTAKEDVPPPMEEDIPF